jgi:outer membrane protein assembly factor BamB
MIHGRGRAVGACAAVALTALLVSGCAAEPDGRENPKDVLGSSEASWLASQGDAAGFALTTLPTSGVIVTGRSGAVCYSHKGDEEWRFEVPEGEEIVASPAVSPDSRTFILTSGSLVALSIRGEVLWIADVEAADPAAVLALGDGTAVVTAGSNALVNYESGRLRWRFELPDGDTIASMPRAASNSHVFVQGAARLYVVDPSGIPVWDRPL